MYKYSKEAKEKILSDTHYACFFLIFSMMPERHTLDDEPAGEMRDSILAEMQAFAAAQVSRAGEGFQSWLEDKFGEKALKLFNQI